MTDASRHDQIEFIRLGGQTVRVTSLVPGDQAGSYRLVTIARGTRDVEILAEILGQHRVRLELPGREPVEVRATDIDRRAFGEGQSGITRFAVLLTTIDGTGETPGEADHRSLEERVAALETELAELRAIVSVLRGNDQ